MNRRELINEMHDRLEGYTRNEVHAAMLVFQDVVTEALASGDPVSIAGFVTFKIKEVPARQAGLYPNPFKKDEDGNKVMEKRPARPASKRVVIRPLKALKEAVA